jgi:hypothetical protein
LSDFATDFSLEAFVAQLNSKFTMKWQAGTLQTELELVEATELDSSARIEQFSLIFKANQEAPPYQSIYSLEHQSLGTAEVFLVPIKRDQEGLYYQAIFNRFRK